MADQPPIHEYDGIQECDHGIPRWFMWLFYVTLAWGALYVAWYHVLGRPLGPERLALQRQQALAGKAASGPLAEEDLRALAADPGRIARGKALYGRVGCVTCHGAEALGTVGPNLRDEWWLFGSDMTEQVAVIAEGRGQMPAQRTLSREEVVDLVCYLVALNRQGPATGKPHDPKREHRQPIAW